ncbi:MAG: permease, partial [Acidobacteria bacterium]
LREVDKNQPVQSITTMEDMIAAKTAEPRFQARLLGAFSILALVLSAIGIYGVLAYSVTERTHEIGIRMALGAEARDVVGMVLRRTLVLVGVGIALGTAGALAVTGVLEKFLFEVKPTDLAVLAGLLPARRAAKVDPLVSLRYE